MQKPEEKPCILLKFYMALNG